MVAVVAVVAAAVVVVPATKHSSSINISINLSSMTMRTRQERLLRSAVMIVAADLLGEALKRYRAVHAPEGMEMQVRGLPRSSWTCMPLNALRWTVCGCEVSEVVASRALCNKESGGGGAPIAKVMVLHANVGAGPHPTARRGAGNAGT